METETKQSVFAIRNVRMFIAFRVFFNARFYYPVFTVLFIDFGLTLSQFAVLNAVWAATIVILEVPSGALADTIGRRNLLVAAGAIMVVEIGLIAWVPPGDRTLVFIAFLINRILSGAAEAAASGADEAIAYDALQKAGRAADWPRVLEWQMRIKSIAFIGAMSLGAAVYDPVLMQRLAGWFGVDGSIGQSTTLKFPIYLTLIMAVLTLAAALRMRETDPGGTSETCSLGKACGRSMGRALRLTLRAGAWILRTPFALVIILFGLMFDHVIRMIMTMASQYYRLIALPEASFGIIGSGLAVLGFFIPRVARALTERYSPRTNLGIVSVLTFIGLIGMVPFYPVFGLIPVVFLTAVSYLTAFFVSHYLNHITRSEQRATVLSFKGLSFNLAYGFIGLMYSILLAGLRSGIVRGQIEEAGAALENMVFIQSIAWFPGYFFIAMALMAAFARRKMKHVPDHKHPVLPAADRLPP